MGVRTLRPEQGARTLAAPRATARVVPGLDRVRRLAVWHLTRAAAEGKRDACALVAQLSAGGAALLVLWSASRRLVDLAGGWAVSLLALVWAAALGAAGWWCRTYWSPGAAQRAAAAERAAQAATARHGAMREPLGLAPVLRALSERSTALPAAERRRVRHLAATAAGEADQLVADALDAGLVRVERATGALTAAFGGDDALRLLERLVEHRRLELCALLDGVEAQVGGSVRARLAARVEVDSCDLASPRVVATGAGAIVGRHT
jgi:hypothetical protein